MSPGSLRVAHSTTIQGPYHLRWNCTPTPPSIAGGRCSTGQRRTRTGDLTRGGLLDTEHRAASSKEVRDGARGWSRGEGVGGGGRWRALQQGAGARGSHVVLCQRCHRAVVVTVVSHGVDERHAGVEATSSMRHWYVHQCQVPRGKQGEERGRGAAACSGQHVPTAQGGPGRGGHRGTVHQCHATCTAGGASSCTPAPVVAADEGAEGVWAVGPVGQRRSTTWACQVSCVSALSKRQAR